MINSGTILNLFIVYLLAGFLTQPEIAALFSWCVEEMEYFIQKGNAGTANIRASPWPAIFEDLATEGLLICPSLFVAFSYVFFFLEPGLSFWLTYPVFCPNFPSPKTFWSRLDYIEQPVIFFPCINSFTFCETCLFAFSPRIPVSQHFLPLCEAVLLFFSCVYCCWLCKAPGEQVVVLRISDHDLMQKVEYSELLYIR